MPAEILFTQEIDAIRGVVRVNVYFESISCPCDWILICPVGQVGICLTAGELSSEFE